METKVKPKRYVEKFILTILLKSDNKNWKEAVKEWKYLDSRIEHSYSECLCGQEIKEVCIIYNEKTGCTAEIGNICINHFIGEGEIKRRSSKVFSSIKRLKKSNKASIDQALLVEIYHSGCLSIDEFLFYNKIINRKKLTADEAQFKIKINDKIKIKWKIK